MEIEKQVYTSELKREVNKLQKEIDDIPPAESLPKQLLNGVYAGSSEGVGDVSLNFHTNTSSVDIKTPNGTIEASYTQSGDNLTFEMSGTTIGTGVIKSSFEIVVDLGSEMTLAYIGSVNTAIVDNNIVQNKLTLGTGLSIENGALTANGGSGGKLYRHSIEVNNTVVSICTIDIITSIQYTFSYQMIEAFLNNNGYTSREHAYRCYGFNSIADQIYDYIMYFDVNAGVIYLDYMKQNPSDMSLYHTQTYINDTYVYTDIVNEI